MKKILCIYLIPVLIGSFSIRTNAQTGPGSVGTNTGSSSLRFWVKGDAGITMSGMNQVSAWADQSGYGSNALQSVLAKQPVWTANQVNGNPSLVLDGIDDAFGIAYPLILPNLNSISHFMVYKLNNTAASLPVVFNTNVNVTGQYYGYETNGWGGTNINRMDVLAGFANDATFTTPGLSTSGSWKLFSTITNTNIHNSTARYNGSDLVMAPTGANVAMNFRLGDPAGAVNVIGAVPFPGHPYLNGEFCEMIVFDSPVNTAQRNIIENYLSAKYNVTLSANDWYTGDNGINGDYDSDVMGIGRFSVIEQHIVPLDNNKGMNITDGGFIADDNDYLMYGHRNESWGTVNGIFGGGCVQRWFRTFYLDKSDAGANGGGLTIDFDFVDGNSPIMPGVAANYRLLTGAGFLVSVPFSSLTIVGGNIVRFAVNATDIADGVYTIGSADTLLSPLPVLSPLLSTCSNQDHIKLNWESIAQQPVANFSLERSTGDQPFSSIANTGENADHHFEIIDRNVIPGQIYYYRILSEFEDGSAVFSNIVESKIIPNSKNGWTIFPNPAEDFLNIQFDENATEFNCDFSIVNSMGQVVWSKSEMFHSENFKMTADLSEIQPGIYFLEIRTSGKFISRKLVIR